MSATLNSSAIQGRLGDRCQMTSAKVAQKLGTITVPEHNPHRHSVGGELAETPSRKINIYPLMNPI